MPTRRIQDYFEPYKTKEDREPGSYDIIRRSKPSPSLVQQVPGLSVLTAFITAEEESAILSFLDAQQWRTDLIRRTMHYGGTYCLMPSRTASSLERKEIEDTVITAPKIPIELHLLVEKMVEQGLYPAHFKPQYCIINEYLPGQGISAHVENFRFGEPVCSLTLAGQDTMRFHELASPDDGSVRSGKAAAAPRTGKHVDILLRRRSLAVLTGDARNKWQHEIVRGRKSGKPVGWRRVSLTFRTDKTKMNGETVEKEVSMMSQIGNTGVITAD